MSRITRVNFNWGKIEIADLEALNKFGEVRRCTAQDQRHLRKIKPAQTPANQARSKPLV
jgi:hypothetical protein